MKTVLFSIADWAVVCEVSPPHCVFENKIFRRSFRRVGLLFGAELHNLTTRANNIGIEQQRRPWHERKEVCVFLSSAASHSPHYMNPLSSKKKVKALMKPLKALLGVVLCSSANPPAAHGKHKAYHSKSLGYITSPALCLHHKSTDPSKLRAKHEVRERERLLTRRNQGQKCGFVQAAADWTERLLFWSLTGSMFCLLWFTWTSSDWQFTWFYAKLNKNGWIEWISYIKEWHRPSKIMVVFVYHQEYIWRFWDWGQECHQNCPCVDVV